MDTFKTIVDVLTQPEVLATVLTILGAFGVGASKSKVFGGESFKKAKDWGIIKREGE